MLTSKSISLKAPWCSQTECQTHIGVVVNLRTNTFEIPDHKRHTIAKGIAEILKAHRCSIRASIAGQISALFLPIGPLIAIFCRALHKEIATATHWDARLRLSIEAVEELYFWEQTIWEPLSSPIWPVPSASPTLELFIDASDSGWGAWLALSPVHFWLFFLRGTQGILYPSRGHMPPLCAQSVH